MPVILYTGLDPSRYQYEGTLIHCPLIEVVPHPFDSAIQNALSHFEQFTDIVFTSKSSLPILLFYLEKIGKDISCFGRKNIWSVGKATTQALCNKNLVVSGTATIETAEGLVALLQQDLSAQSFFFLPQSSLSRKVVDRFLSQQKIPFMTLPVYHTVPTRTPLPDLDFNVIDEIVFTSPSTVQAFLFFFKKFPPVRLTAIGPITQEAMDKIILAK